MLRSSTSVTSGVWMPMVWLLWCLGIFVPMVGVSYVPSFFRLRRVLADGYHVDDLHTAMREHQLARSEEIERRGLEAYASEAGGPIEESFETLLTGLAVRYYKAVAG